MTKESIKIDGKLKEKFTVEDELEFYKQVLIRKEKEFERLKAEKDNYKQNLKDIYKLFVEFANEDIITCSDLCPSENYKIILEKFRTVLVKVLYKSGEALND